MKRSRLILVLIGAVILVMVVAWIAGNLFVHSDGFRKFLERRVSQSIRADGTFQSLHWNNWTFYSDGFTAKGRPKSKLVSLKASGISAHLQWTRLFFGQAVIDQVNIEKLDATLGPPTERTPSPSSQGPKLGFHGPKPHLEIQKIFVHDADLHWTSRHGSIGQLTGVQIAVTRNGSKSWQLSATGGTIGEKGFPNVAFKQGTGRIDKNTVNIDQATFVPDGGGELKLQGTLSHRAQTQIRIDFHDLRPANFVPAKFALHGTASGNVEYKGSLDHSGRGELLGFVKMSAGGFDPSEVFGKARQILQMGGIHEMQFDQIETNFTHQDHRTEFSNFAARYRDQALIKGGGTVEHGQINATLSIGVAPDLVSWIPGAIDSVFTDSHDGLQWATAKVTGTLSQPREDLSKRLLAAAKDKFKKDFKNQAKDAAKSLLDLLNH